jgi:hypothetical protein
MDKSYPSKTPMVVRSLEVDKDQFRPKGGNVEVSGPEVTYLNVIGVLMYIANCTRPDISFVVNLLARYRTAPTQHHWAGVKEYLQISHWHCRSWLILQN